VSWAAHKVGGPLLRGVREFGYSVTASLPEPHRPGYSYSVGLAVHKLPELLIADMPANLAVDYLQTVIDSSRRRGVFPQRGDKCVMCDGSIWDVASGDAKDAEYRVLWALRLYGDRYRVRVLRLVPPPNLRYPKYSPWQNCRCDCGCAEDNPLAVYAHQVGSKFVGSTG
jgi:hypothetical protein